MTTPCANINQRGRWNGTPPRSNKPGGRAVTIPQRNIGAFLEPGTGGQQYNIDPA